MAKEDIDEVYTIKNNEMILWEISVPAGYNKQYVDSTLILNQEVLSSCYYIRVLV